MIRIIQYSNRWLDITDRQENYLFPRTRLKGTVTCSEMSVFGVKLRVWWRAVSVSSLDRNSFASGTRLEPGPVCQKHLDDLRPKMIILASRCLYVMDPSSVRRLETSRNSNSGWQNDLHSAFNGGAAACEALGGYQRQGWGSVQDRTTNLAVNGQPSLPPEPQLPTFTHNVSHKEQQGVQPPENNEWSGGKGA